MGLRAAKGRIGRGASLLALVFALAALPGGAALAQSAGESVSDPLAGVGKTVPEGTPLLLEADRLIYNRDDETVTARGNVAVAYGPYRLVAEEISYNQRTGRLVARGSVELVEPDGNRLYADEIDVTDDFAEGFVNGLRIETADNTRFAAQSAVRGSDGTLTVFNNGVYTACEPCADEPEEPLTWRVRARTVIWNQQERTITFQRPSFEFFGRPIFATPGFTVPDPTVRRRTGFLIPGLRYGENLGVGLTVPYYFALNPSYDATVEGTLYTRQGLLAEGQFRRRFATGDLELRAAAIAQASPGAFDEGTEDDTTFRGMLGARGDFRINPRWQWGFDALLQSDRNFANTYDIEGYGASTFVNNVYLIGLDDRSYFEIKAEEFTVQTASPNALDTNPIVYPSLDYQRTFDSLPLGGELLLDVNALNLHRSNRVCRSNILDPTEPGGFRLTTDCDPTDPIRGLGVREIGVEGDYARVSGELAWSGLLTTPQGLVIEPLLAARLDGVHVDAEGPRPLGQPAALDDDPLRTMATLGGTVRFPILARTQNANHVIEPVAQLFVRPDESRDGAIVNEDAQSLVFDGATLLERDKFSGYDRIEGGTRANLALRYGGAFGGYALDAIVGQSFHLAGENPFARGDLDLGNVGADSGLETDRSDLVADVTLATPIGLSVSAGARLDEDDLAVRAASVRARYSDATFSAVARYDFVDAQPSTETPVPRHEVQAGGRVRLGEHWAVRANGTYDIEADALYRRAVGIEYADECFAYSLDYSERERELGAVNRSVRFNVSLRTIGDFGTGSAFQ